MWARGIARVDGNDIVLRREDAEDYVFFEQDRLDKLVLDVAGLRNIGTLTDSEQLDPQLALAFVRRHGLLWHGPEQLASGECREPLRSWYFEGEELTLSIALYMTLRESLNTSSTQPLQQYLRLLRDLRIFWGAMPQDSEELLSGISIALAERVNKGMEGCKQTFLAACGLELDGVRLGPPGDFRYSVDPKSLLAAAYSQFASLIVTKARFKGCPGCGQIFRAEHGNRIYCSSTCSERARKRKQRAKSAP
jgi:ribosomal protein S27AE